MTDPAPSDPPEPPSVNRPAAVTEADLEAAGRVAGVTYTEAERAMLAETIAGQIELAVKRRAFPLPPTLPPATRFDPRLPGWTPPDPTPFAPATTAPPPLPEREDDIAFAPVTWQRAWIRNRTLSSVRLTRHLPGPHRPAQRRCCPAIATVTAELALAQARQADRLLADGQVVGPLHGIPWGCKDILDTAGIVTGWGAEPWRDRVPAEDATVVRRLAEAGAVMLGKTTVGALAYGDIWYGGRTRNPWNTEEGSSGSSAGSGSATAAGLVGVHARDGDAGLHRRPVACAAAPPGCARPSAACRAPARCRCAGRSTRSARSAARSRIRRWCWPRSTAPIRPTRCGIDAPFGYDARAPIAGLRLGYYAADFAAEGAHDAGPRGAGGGARRSG